MTPAVLNLNLRVFRVFLAIMHTGIGVLSFVQPDMVDVIPSYRAFAALAPTSTWGMTALLIGLGLLVMPKGSFALILWQTFSASLFMAFAVLVASGPFGFLTWGVWIYLMLAGGSFTVMWFTARQWTRSIDYSWLLHRYINWQARRKERHKGPAGS